MTGKIVFDGGPNLRSYFCVLSFSLDGGGKLKVELRKFVLPLAAQTVERDHATKPIPSYER